jgi:hypothetical protein
MAKGRMEFAPVDRSGAGLREDQKLAKAICNVAFTDARFVANALNYNASNAMIARDVQAFSAQTKGAGRKKMVVDGTSLWVTGEQQNQLALEIRARQQCSNGMWGVINSVIRDHDLGTLSGSQTAALQTELKSRLKKLATTGRTSSVEQEAEGANVAMEQSGVLSSPRFAAAVASVDTSGIKLA